MIIINITKSPLSSSPPLPPEMPAQSTSTFNPLDPAPLAILVGRETELNWEPRDRLIDSMTRYCIETQPALQYPSIGSFGSLADLRQASFGTLTGSNQNSNSSSSNDPRVLLSSLLKINYEDILQTVKGCKRTLCLLMQCFSSCSYTLPGPN